MSVARPTAIQNAINETNAIGKHKTIDQATTV
jgi:hypothetical protein